MLVLNLKFVVLGSLILGYAVEGQNVVKENQVCEPKCTQKRCRPDCRNTPKNQRDCQDILCNRPNSESYQLDHAIYIGTKHVQVFCEMINGEGWTVIQRRTSPKGNFNRDWRAFEYGFTDFNTGDFWIGNKWLSKLTLRTHYELIVKLTTTAGKEFSVKYSSFRVGPKDDIFPLTTDGMSKCTGPDKEYADAFKDVLGKKFSTWNVDKDDWTGGNCAKKLGGGFWYGECGTGNLNAKAQFFKWNGVPLQKSVMMIRKQKIAWG